MSGHTAKNPDFDFADLLNSYLYLFTIYHFVYENTANTY